MRVLVSGGGTAGHVYPALAVAALVKADDRNEIAFVGAPGGLEESLAAAAGMRFIPVRASGWDRARPWTLFTALGVAITSLLRCFRVLGRERTDVVAGFGGYVSVPLALAAALRGTPLVLHEQNSVPGVANRVLSRWARAVCVTYEASRQSFPCSRNTIVTGNPVRESVLRADREAGRRTFGVGPDERLLLVFGGSRGARHINSAMLNLYSRLSDIESLKVVHIAGPTEMRTVVDALRQRAGGVLPDRWSVVDYVQGMGDLMAAADLVVCRSGATTLAEVAVLGRPAILIPYPYATDDHQTRNAEPFVAAGAALAFADARIDDAAFGDALVQLLEDEGALARMAQAARTLGRPYAADAFVEVLGRAAAGGRTTSIGEDAR